MRFSSAIALACSLPLVVKAAPVLQTRALASNDALVLKFAEALNELESNFYSSALAKFKDADFSAAGFSVTDIPKQVFKEIQSDEQAHINFLTGALKANQDSTIAGCKFDFSSVLTDVKTMSAVARVVEQVGVSAFLGAAALVSDRSILGAAATILTTEARHQSLLNTLNGGTAVPQAFDQALSPQQVLALASPFISGCDFGIPANLPVKIKNQVAPGNKLDFDITGIKGDKLFCQMVLGGQPIALSQPIDNCVVPNGLPNGPVFIFITDDMQPLASNVIIQNAAEIKAGPAIVFIDQQPDALGQLVRNTGNGSNGNGQGAPKQEDANGSNQDIKVIGMSKQPA